MAAASKKIICESEAGFEDKGDVLIRLKPGPAGSGINIIMQSRVAALFGDQIHSAVHEELEKHGLSDVQAEVIDKGALDYTIRARTQTAIKRALKGGE